METLESFISSQTRFECHQLNSEGHTKVEFINRICWGMGHPYPGRNIRVGGDTVAVAVNTVKSCVKRGVQPTGPFLTVASDYNYKRIQRL